MPHYRVYRKSSNNLNGYPEVYINAKAMLEAINGAEPADVTVYRLASTDPNGNAWILSPLCLEEIREEVYGQTEIASSMRMEAASDKTTAAESIDYKGQVQKASHYQNFIDDYQWIDAEMRKPWFRDDLPAAAKALGLQISKYLSREGRKDDVIKENLKAVWYIHYKVAMLLEGKPIRADDVPAILKKHGF